MNREHHAGKGDSPRKVDGDAYRKNHDAIFQKTLLEVCQLCQDCDCMEDRDYWRAEAERWRDCHHEIIADRDWLILELVEISSTADNCEDTWDALAKIGVIADNILNGRPLP